MTLLDCGLVWLLTAGLAMLSEGIRKVPFARIVLLLVMQGVF